VSHAKSSESEKFEVKRNQWFVERSDLGSWVRCSPMLAFEADARDFAIQLSPSIGCPTEKMRLIEQFSHVIETPHPVSL
jgi:hypothetical protein